MGQLTSAQLRYWDLNFILSKLGFRKFEARDIVAMVKVLTGKYGNVGAYEAFKHHQSKFACGRIMYDFLLEKSMVTSYDKYALGIGRKEVERGSESNKVDSDGDSVTYETKRCLLRVGNSLAEKDSNWYFVQQYLDTGEFELGHVYFYYPAQNILMYGRR